MDSSGTAERSIWLILGRPDVMFAVILGAVLLTFLSRESDDDLTPSLVLARGRFFEGPRWHESCLFFSDFNAHRVMVVRLERSGGGFSAPAVFTEDASVTPSGLGW